MDLILFDMMDTLLKDPYFGIVGELLPDSRERESYFQSRRRASFEAFEKGEIGEGEYFRRFYREDIPENLRLILPRPEKIKKRILRQVRPNPGVRELLEKLRKREEIRLGIASNYSPWYGEILEGMPWISETFHYFFFSCEMGFRKPDREYYRMIDSTLRGEDGRPRFEAVYFLDDREANLLPAKEFGWSVHKWSGSEETERWLSEVSGPG